MSEAPRLSHLLVAAALISAAMITGCSRPTTMLILESGKVYPSPENGDILKFVDQQNNRRKVQWIGPGSDLSPCVEQQGPGKENTTSDTCTVHFTTTKIKVYHYSCLDPGGSSPGCIDPGVPGPRSGGGGQQRLLFRSAGGNTNTAQAGANGQSSGVWYFPSDGSAGGFIAIPVNQGSDNKYDQIVWEDAGDAKWQVVVPSGTCKETGPFSDSGQHVCTVTATQSQNYCVVYGNNTPGTAVIQIVGAGAPTNAAPSPCSQ